MSRNAVRETIGFLGVMASLVFVGIEIRQNTTVARAQARQALADASAVLNLALTDPFLNGQLWALRTLDADEEIDCQAAHAEACQFVHSLLRHHENVLLQVREGLIDESALNSYGWRNNGIYLSPGFQRYWTQRGRSYDPIFIEAFEAEYDLVQ